MIVRLLALAALVLFPAAAEAKGGLKVGSHAFVSGKDIPKKYSCDGDNAPPELLWIGVPSTAKSFALIVEDPDAPNGLWTHWVVYNIPKRAFGLDAGLPAQPEMPNGIRQGKNSSGKTGYAGPCPPHNHNFHRYFFRLYALDTVLGLAPDAATGATLKAAMDGHVVARAEMMGLYKR
jgi:Raf kinase inhibitor-like YbhB/YbcL family protein